VPFFTPTRVTKLEQPTRDVATVQEAAVGLLDRLELGRPVRLLGVRVTLTDPEAPTTAESGGAA
jgi:DNA polymerase-4